MSPYGAPLPIIARSPNPPRKTTVYVAGEGTTYVAVAVPATPPPTIGSASSCSSCDQPSAARACREVGEQVVGVLEPDRHAHESVGDASLARAPPE